MMFFKGHRSPEINELCKKSGWVYGDNATILEFNSSNSNWAIIQRLKDDHTGEYPLECFSDKMKSKTRYQILKDTNGH